MEIAKERKSALVQGKKTEYVQGPKLIRPKLQSVIFFFQLSEV
jgi:hypothetical protein